MGDINPTNPLWPILLLVVGMFGSFHMLESNMPTEPHSSPTEEASPVVPTPTPTPIEPPDG